MFFKKFRTMPPGFQMFENANGTFFWKDTKSGYAGLAWTKKALCRSAAWYSYDRMEEDRIFYPRLIEEGK